MPGRKYSEGEVRKALTSMDLELEAYKPPDSPGAMQNPKPADFLVWYLPDDGESSARACWVEVKESDATEVLGWQTFRPSQFSAMRRAQHLGIRYLVVVHWGRWKRWTITTGSRVLARYDNARAPYQRGEMPISCEPAELASQLRMAILGEVD